MAKQEYYLIVDCASRQCLVSIVDNQRHILENESISLQHRHGDYLPDIVNAMSEGYHIDNILITVGPGSFTGLRTSIAYMRAYAMALSIPIYGIKNTCAYARYYHNTHQDKKIMVIIDTKRQDYIYAIFVFNNNYLKYVQEEVTINQDNLMRIINNHDYIICGDGAISLVEKYHHINHDNNILVQSKYIFDSFYHDNLYIQSSILPLYLRPAA